jgi:hypothetical protein
MRCNSPEAPTYGKRIDAKTCKHCALRDTARVG